MGAGIVSSGHCDSESGIIPADATFAGWMIEAGGLVEDAGGFGEGEEAVGESFGDPETVELVACEMDAGPAAEVRGVRTDVHYYVPDMAEEDAH